jgi:hypothetical protein
MTHYETLGVEPDVTPEDLVKVYRRLAMEYHPDRVPEHLTELKKDAEERFKGISEAFAILSDPLKRQQYDDQLRYQGARARDSDGARRKAQAEAERRRAAEEARKRAEDEALQEALRRYHREAAEKGRQRRLKALERKKRMLIAAGIAAVLAALSPLLIAGGRWLEETGLKSWWRASAAVGDAEKTLGIETSVGASTDGWWVEDLQLYPVARIEKDDAPNAVAVLRGYIKGLPGCYVVPARGAVVSETNGTATVRVELERLGRWNQKKSWMGSCRPGFASIEAYLEGRRENWQALDLAVVDSDAKLERVFTAAKVQGLVQR